MSTGPSTASVETKSDSDEKPAEGRISPNAIGTSIVMLARAAWFGGSYFRLIDSCITQLKA